MELASGGMATVHLARDRSCHHGSALVAIKRPHRHLAADRAFLTMLVDEARLASAIRHPNVVRVRELGFDGGVPFIVMDYVEGASLAELRRELGAVGRAIDARVAVRIALDMLAGLTQAHELCDDAGRPLRIIHRDVSPHNILIGTDGRARITDFGIAKAEDRVQTTRTHEVKGKLAYLAPERVDRRRLCTVQSDVFSAGLVLWECLAGRRLFRSEQVVDLIDEVMTAPIPKLRDVGTQLSCELDDVIARALSRDLEMRYASADAFSKAIVAAVGPSGIGAHDDVARLVETVFGEHIKARHEHVRAAVGAEALAELLLEAGLRNRDENAAPSTPSSVVLAELAPPAPATRYGLRAPPPPAVSVPTHWLGLTVGLLAGVVLGVVAMSYLALRSSDGGPNHASGSTLDGSTHPATNVAPYPRARSAVVDPPPPIGPAAPIIVAPPRRAQPPRDASAPHGPGWEGTVRDGFTKLR
ncbi:MAG: serine/threonine protein kinase [Polyangiaceae bacterium]|nr:serine/threonine protein kinase [Polyangiaceae bacterium]